MQPQHEKDVVAQYWFEHIAPKDFINSEHNASEIARYLFERNLDTTFDSLNAALRFLGDINNGGRLQFNPKPIVVEKIVYKAPEKTAEDTAREKREKFERTHALGLKRGSDRTELDRGDENKIILTEQEKQAINARNKQQDEIVADTWHKIQTFTGHSHARTFSGREDLKKVFTDAMNRHLPAEQIEKLVDAKLEKLAR